MPISQTESLPPANAAPGLQTDAAPWAGAARALLPWLVPAMLTLHMKRYMMIRGMGYQLVARFMGRVETIYQSGLTRGEEFSFYRSDLLVSCLIAPLVLLILARWMPRSWRVPFVAVVSGIVSAVLYVQLRSLEEVGRFLSADMFTTALSWGWHEPVANTAYLGSQGMIGILAPVFYIAGVWWWNRRTRRDFIEARTSSRRVEWTGAIMFCSVAVVTAVAWIPRMPPTGYHESILVRSVHAFWGDPEVNTREFAGLNGEELVRQYRDFTHAPVSRHDPQYWGRERGANVLFFVMETMPARFLPPDGAWDEYPNLRRLRERSFAPLEHYATYPYTDHALFSLFSSWYPTSGIKSFERRHADSLVPGVIRTLAEDGYRTVTYHPDSWTGQLHGEMFRALGFQQNRVPDLASPGLGLFGSSSWKQERVAADRAALTALEYDVGEFAREKKGFAAAFFPEIGHAPWPDDGAHGGEADLLRRAHAIVATQDGWLGELIAVLEKNGELENTIIVVCGDHGPRTRLEDPDFAGGAIEEESFHVPLLIYAPRALDHEAKISWLTSHIDVAPTLLDLLGIDRGRQSEQGAPIWEPDLQQRTTFLFASQTLGADGYYSAGHFFMWGQMTGGVAESTEPHFRPADFALPNSAVASGVKRELLRMLALQEVWTSRFGQGTNAPASK